MSKTMAQVARAVATAIQAGNWAAALAAIDTGEQAYPDATLPHDATWAKLRAVVQLRQAPAMLAAEAAEAQQPESVADVAEQDQAEDAPADESAPPTTGRTLYIVHTVDNGTIITGTQKDDGTKDIIGSDGQRWSWHRTERYWFLGKSAGFAADAERIGFAAQALRACGWTVEIEIDNKHPQTGRIAPDKADSDYRRHRLFECRMHARQLEAQTQGSTGESAEIEPQAVPVYTPAEALVRLAVFAESDRPIGVPRPVAALPATTAAPLTIGEYLAAEQRVGVRPLGGLDVDTLLAMVKAGDSDAAYEIRVRMGMDCAPVAPVSAPPAPVRRTSRAVAPVSAPPAPAEETEAETETGPIVFKVALTDDAKDRKTASDVRTRLHEHFAARAFARYGAEVAVWLDKSERSIRATVTLAGAPDSVRDRAVRKVRNVVLAQRGVAAEFASAA